LIINELVSNSLKYAFPGDWQGEVYILFTKITGAEYRLRIGDDGQGIPADMDFKRTSSLGLQLVNSLIAQLEGSIDLDRTNGTHYQIVFFGPGSETL
jgi:two-component system, sensor histidine kinase PdtaS